MGPDLTTAIVVGAVVGLLFVALGHAQLVWLARRRRAPEGSSRRGSPVLTLLAWASALLAATALVRALTTRALPDRPAVLVAEELLVVRAKPGLVAAHTTRGADVRRGEPLLRFTGQDGEEARTALRARRQEVAVQLASERMRPLDHDGETVRRAEAARMLLREHERRLAQLVSERDAIEREMAAQRLALESRRYGLEGDDRDAARELEPLAASLETERGVLAGHEALAARGLVARIDAERARDAVAKLDARVRQLRDRRALLARERSELAGLRALARGMQERQLASRAAEQAAEREAITAAQRELAAATEALESDRPRAEAERRRRVGELERQLADCDALLEGRGQQLAVVAPWDGRVGFREPAPEAAPADGGPLLVAYRPGAITAAVRLEPGEARIPPDALDARVVVALPGSAPDLPGGGEVELEGRVTGSARLADGALELRVACDPPDRVVRRLGMGGAVPVVARVRRGLVHMASFRLAVALALASAGLALCRPALARVQRRRRGRRDGDGHGGEGAPTSWVAAAAGVSTWPPRPALPPAAAAAQPASASAGAVR